MKKRIAGILSIVLLCVIFFGTGMAAGASSSAPGTTGDPLITQSYLEKRLSEVSLGSTTTPNTTYKKVSVTKGKKLTAKEGCEFIVYSGEAKVFGSKGIIDVTDGALIANGKKISAYHNYVSPSDQSGVTATANCIIYVKGSYVIE